MKKLKAFMKRNKLTYREVASELNVSVSTVYTWAHGTASPSVASAIMLEKISRGKVSVYSWK